MPCGLNSWQVISPVEVVGYVVAVDELLSVQNKVYEQPTILVAKSVKGEEEIPDGTVAVLTPDMPDVLSHVSVRARNGKVSIFSNHELLFSCTQLLKRRFSFVGRYALLHVLIRTYLLTCKPKMGSCCA